MQTDKNGKVIMDIRCPDCGEKMTVLGDDYTVWYAHCLNKVCDDAYRNSFVFVNLHEERKMAGHWLINCFTDLDWRKKDALEWLNSIWKEYQQYLLDNS